jgi:exosortase/archaeosortase family protein
MKSDNKKLVVAIFFFFLFALYANRQYQEWKGEKYVPNRYKNDEVYQRPTYTTNGLYYLDGSLWISSGLDKALLEYDLTTQKVIRTVNVPCFEAAGLTFDGENFWVADYAKRTIHKVAMDGTIKGSYLTPYSTPYGLAWDGEALWILDVFGLEEYPDLYANIYPNSIIYRYDPDSGKILDTLESPAPFAGDIEYKNGEIIVTGVTSRKIFHINVKAKITTLWYYAPDTLPRAIAAGEDNTYFITGMATNEIFEVNLNKRAQYSDIRQPSKVIIPFWLLIITLILLLPIFLDELMTREYPRKENVLEKLYAFFESSDISAFIVKTIIISVIIYYISDYFLLRKAVALITKAILDQFGVYTAYVAGSDFVFLEGCSIEKSCLSLFFVAVLVGAIFATTISFKKKVLLSFVGFGIISAWNILRLGMLIVLLRENVPTVLSHDVFFYVGGFVMLAVALKICSVLAPEIGKDFSRIAKSAEETFLTFYSHEE